MKFDGYDYIIVGIILTTGATLLLAKAYLMPTFPVENAETFLDLNPFQIRNGIITRHESIAGGVWLFGAAVVSIVGIVRTVQFNVKGYLVSHWLEIIVLIAFFLVLWRLTLMVTFRTSRSEYVPILSQHMLNLFERDFFVLSHEGRYRQEAGTDISISPSTAENRLSSATRTLDNIGKLFDEPRLLGEDNMSYAKKLSKYFPDASLE